MHGPIYLCPYHTEVQECHQQTTGKTLSQFWYVWTLYDKNTNTDVKTMNEDNVENKGETVNETGESNIRLP